MRSSSAWKAVLILLNHGLALISPAIAVNIVPSLKHRRDLASASSVAIPQEPTSAHPNLILRAPKTNKDKRKCDRCVARCGRMKIHDPKDCTRCKLCPPRTHPDKAQKTCIRDSAQDRERKVKETSDRKQGEYDFKKDKKRSLPKSIRFGDAWKKKSKVYKEFENKRNNMMNRKRVRRMARCVLIVPLALGVEAIQEYSNGFFDESFLESMELLDLWPGDLKDANPDYLTDAINSDKYLDQWIKYAKTQFGKRSLSSNDIMEGPSQNEDDTDLALIGHRTNFIRALGEALPSLDIHLVRRCPICFLIPIFAAAVGTAARVGARAGSRIGGRLGKLLSPKNFKVTKGKGKNTHKQQKDGAKKISENPNWRRCIAGQAPQK